MLNYNAILIPFLFLISSAAFAGEPIDFSRHILDPDGKDIPTSKESDAPPMDLARLAQVGLLTEPPADPRGPQMGMDAKLARYNLWLKIHGGGLVSLTSEEITLLKTAIAAVSPPLLVGRAIEILDPVKKP